MQHSKYNLLLYHIALADHIHICLEPRLILKIIHMGFSSIKDLEFDFNPCFVLTSISI